MKGRAALLGAFGLLLTLALARCQAIAGIEDRKFDPDGGVSPACLDYCTTVNQNCVSPTQSYATPEACQAICALLDPGDTQEPTGNTVSCRTNQAKLAGTISEVQSTYCAAAGPGGANRCGSNCESYCILYAKICPEQSQLQASSLEECEAKCAGLADVPGFDVTDNYSGDTLQCRLVHTSAASVDPAMHCDHAKLVATSPCIDSPGGTPDCASYCQLVTTECHDALAVYESVDECMAVCGALDKGLNGDQTGNTIACRKYHSYNALLDPATHCPHAGPAGDGHCGADIVGSPSTGNCDSYCKLFKAACADTFAQTFTSDADCRSTCRTLPGAVVDSGYSLATAVGNRVSCRIAHASAALLDASECAAAAGQSPCQ